MCFIKQTVPVLNCDWLSCVLTCRKTHTTGHITSVLVRHSFIQLVHKKTEMAVRETKRACRDLCLSSQVTCCVPSLPWIKTCRSCHPVHQPFISILTIYGELTMWNHVSDRAYMRIVPANLLKPKQQQEKMLPAKRSVNITEHTSYICTINGNSHITDNNHPNL